MTARRRIIHVRDIDCSDVVAEHIDCVECGDVYIGDPGNGEVCPSCVGGQTR